MYVATSVEGRRDTVPRAGGRSFGIALRGIGDDGDLGLHQSGLCVHGLLRSQ